MRFSQLDLFRKVLSERTKIESKELFFVAKKKKRKFNITIKRHLESDRFSFIKKKNTFWSFEFTSFWKKKKLLWYLYTLNAQIRSLKNNRIRNKCIFLAKKIQKKKVFFSTKKNSKVSAKFKKPFDTFKTTSDGDDYLLMEL